MKALVLVTLLLLSGCASTIDVKATQSTSFDSVPELAAPAAVQVAPLPAQLPLTIKGATSDGQVVNGFDNPGLKQLLVLKNAAETNTAILKASLDAQSALIIERNLLLKAGKLEQQRANFYAEKWAVAQNQLQSEQLRYTVMDTTYKVLIGLGLLVLIP